MKDQLKMMREAFEKSEMIREQQKSMIKSLKEQVKEMKQVEDSRSEVEYKIRNIEIVTKGGNKIG